MAQPFHQTAPPSDAHRPWKQSIIKICPSCLDEYVLGRTGTYYGCDRCEGIVRDANGMIIPDPFVEVFITQVKAGDPDQSQEG